MSAHFQSVFTDRCVHWVCFSSNPWHIGGEMKHTAFLIQGFLPCIAGVPLLSMDELKFIWIFALKIKLKLPEDMFHIWFSSGRDTRFCKFVNVWLPSSQPPASFWGGAAYCWVSWGGMGSSIVSLSQKLRELDPPSTDQWASTTRSPTVIPPAGWPSWITCILVHCPYRSSCFRWE